MSASGERAEETVVPALDRRNRRSADVAAEGGFAEILKRFMEAAPLAWAAPRAQEALLLGRVDLPGPMLDLGCGDGLFADLAGTRGLAGGLDLGRREARRAAARGVYRWVVRADACRLPFADGRFGSVMSVSTLEHVVELDRVLAEVARVLRPGGRFFWSVPGPEFAPSLFWPRLLGRIGGKRVGRAYARLVDWAFRHVNLLSVDQWRVRVARHGLALLDVLPFNPPAAVALQDFAYPLSVFAAGLRWVSGRWILWKPWRRVSARVLVALLSASLRGAGAAGTCYCLSAELRGRTDS